MKLKKQVQYIIPPLQKWLNLRGEGIFTLFCLHDQAIVFLYWNDLQALITAGIQHLFLPTQICRKRNESYANKTWGPKHVLQNQSEQWNTQIWAQLQQGLPTSFMVIKQSHTHLRGYLRSAACSYGDWTQELLQELILLCFGNTLITLQERASQTYQG